MTRISINEKDKAAIIEQFENNHGIEIEVLKGKYLNHAFILYRKALIKQILKYKAMTQVELSKYLGITEGQVSRIYNSKE